jgi:5-methylcytosine-specific restriction endonuclease McrA
MGDALAKLASAENRRSDRARRDSLNANERAALRSIRREARRAGSYLSSGGKGGLPPSLVLGVLRRDRFQCKVCGELGNKDTNGGIGVHHKGGIPESKWLAHKGHSNDPNNIVSICANCHDNVHEKAREEGIESS